MVTSWSILASHIIGNAFQTTQGVAEACRAKPTDQAMDTWCTNIAFAGTNEVLEPTEQLWVLSKEGRHQLHQFRFRNDLLIEQLKTTQKVGVHLLASQCFADIIEEGIVV